MRDTYRDLSTQESVLTSTDSEVCPICHGTEWILKSVDGVDVATPCSCRKKAIMRRRISFAEIPEGFKDMRLNTFSLAVYQLPESKEKARVACKIIKAWLDDFAEMKDRGMGLYIFSGTKGSGKTRMAASIANELIEKHGTVVKFATSTKILNEIRKTYDRENKLTESQLIDALVTADVLIIDDFGTENVTAWVKDKFYDIVNQRYVSKRVTIFTSNESLKTLAYDDRITNRIKEMCYQVDFPEESVREHIAEKNMNEIIGRAINQGKENEKKKSES